MLAGVLHINGYTATWIGLVAGSWKQKILSNIEVLVVMECFECYMPPSFMLLRMVGWPCGPIIPTGLYFSISTQKTAIL